MDVHNSNTIIKFVDNPTLVGLITNDDETAFRAEGNNNNFSLNVNKTKELIVDYRKQRVEHVPIHIDGSVVERVKSFKFLDVHITKTLSWSTHSNTVVKRAGQCLSPSVG